MFGRLVAEVGQLGHRGLHAERHFVGVDAGERFGVAGFGGAEVVELGEVVEQRAALVAVDAGRVVEIEDGVRAGAEADALVRRGQEAAAPESREDRLAGVLAGALRDHGDERGQVFVRRCRGRS